MMWLVVGKIAPKDQPLSFQTSYPKRIRVGIKQDPPILREHLIAISKENLDHFG